ncbi:MAG: exo-alpha-sialidase [Clostridia bacterium]|nr:exo-alpha-sialidase [Clostridia bacterium]
MKTETIKLLTPSPDNARNSEGDFIRLNDGRILFIYTRYDAGDGDDDAANLYGLVSDDDGEHFGEPFPVFSRADLQADNIMSVTLRRMDNGDVGLFFLVKKQPQQCRLYLARSKDEGTSWSAPKACIPHRGYFVVNNDRVVRLSDGRWIIPAAHIPVLTDDETDKAYFDGPNSIVRFYVSDDDANTWRMAGCCRPGGGFQRTCTGLQEPGLIERKDGVLWAYFRTGEGRHYEAFSFDRGETWTDTQPSGFTGPDSPMSVKRLSDGRLFAVWNPVPIYNGRGRHVNNVWTGGRTPLVCAFSEDDGVTFSAPEVIDDDPGRGFSYTSVFETHSGILLAFCAGGADCGGMLNTLRIIKVYEEDQK